MKRLDDIIAETKYYAEKHWMPECRKELDILCDRIKNVCSEEEGKWMARVELQKEATHMLERKCANLEHQLAEVTKQLLEENAVADILAKRVAELEAKK